MKTVIIGAGAMGSLFGGLIIALFKTLVGRICRIKLEWYRRSILGARGIQCGNCWGEKEGSEYGTRRD
jgi:hypothetical protein